MSTSIKFMGWILAAGGGMALLVGLSDMENYAIVLTIGLFLLPLGVLLVASALILKRLAILESHAKSQATNQAEPPARAEQ